MPVSCWACRSAQAGPAALLLALVPALLLQALLLVLPGLEATSAPPEWALALRAELTVRSVLPVLLRPVMQVRPVWPVQATLPVLPVQATLPVLPVQATLPVLPVPVTLPVLPG